MAIKRKIRCRMFAVSCRGIGIIGGTMGYTRREAIMYFQGGGYIPKEWESYKRLGYRTVQCMVRIITRVSAQEKAAA